MGVCTCGAQAASAFAAVSSSLIGSGGIVDTALDAPRVWLDGWKAWVPFPMLGISPDMSWYKGTSGKCPVRLWASLASFQRRKDAKDAKT
jgi:hypothetical protein